MKIRPARVDDFAAIASITNHYIETSPAHFAYEPVTAEELQSMWERHQAHHPWFVADDVTIARGGSAAPRSGAEGGAELIVGYAKSTVWRERSAYAWTAEVGLYVDASAQGRGTGTALYEQLLGDLRMRGFRSAVAGITLPNHQSIGLHKKFGFDHVGTFADAGWKLGAWHDVDWWQKRFAIGPDKPLSLG